MRKTIKGMRWGTYRTDGRGGKIAICQSRTQARENEVGGVLRLATELLPNDSLTWHLLWPVGHISARSWLPISRRRYQEPTENDPDLLTLARDGRCIPPSIQRMRIFNCAYGAMVTWCQWLTSFHRRGFLQIRPVGDKEQASG